MTKTNEADKEKASKGVVLERIVMPNSFRIIGVDLAKPGEDKTVFQCPVCKKFQGLVSKDYLCKSCTRDRLNAVRFGYEA